MSQIATKNDFKEIRHHRSSMMLSSLKEFYSLTATGGFAVKYVARGMERYTFGKERYEVESGNYLLSNTINEGHVEVDSHDAVLGICINLDTDILQNTIASIIRPDTVTPDTDIAKFFTQSLFIENTYCATETKLGKALMQFDADLQARRVSLDNLSEEFFYSISEKIVADYTPVCRQLQSIPAVKPVTKRELYKKILRAKDYMDASFVNPLSVEDIAKECCMSEYHFFRLFKLIFRVSPHKYIIRKRLEFGRNMLEKQQAQVSVAALACGFSDLHSFSAAFRSHFGFTASSLLAKK